MHTNNNNSYSSQANRQRKKSVKSTISAHRNFQAFLALWWPQLLLGWMVI